jgi:hypothetical protein
MFYRRIVAGTFSKKLQWALWIGIAFVTLYTIALGIFMLNMCDPLEAFWKLYDPTFERKYRCLSQDVQDDSAIISGCLSVITDFYSVTLPAILIFKVKVTKRQRWGLFVIFGLGYLSVLIHPLQFQELTNAKCSTVIAGILRTIYLHQLQSSADNDKTWIAYNTVVAGLAEISIGIICACAPSLHHTFRRFFGTTVSTPGSGSSPQLPSFVSRRTNSQLNAERGTPRPPQMASRWQEDREDGLQPVEAYEWHQKGDFSGSKSDSISRLSPSAEFSQPPRRYQRGGQGLGEPQSFLNGATDDEGDSVHLCGSMVDLGVENGALILAN